MKLLDNLKDLKLIFNLIKWYKAHKTHFDGITNSLYRLRGEVNGLISDVGELKAAKNREGAES